jgi:UDP-2-acetamido-2,6-beta-L-arabino-hexul-4-ose reductase
MKHILITGASGFIGKNFIEKIQNSTKYSFSTCSYLADENELREKLLHATHVVHLAGVSRSEDPTLFYTINTDFTKKIISTLEKEGLATPILFTSSIHAEMDNDFGKSKREAEKSLLEHKEKTGSLVYIIRLTNTFGKWAKPNTHSVVATFCFNTQNSLPLTISDPQREINLIYVDDVIDSFLEIIEKGSSLSLLKKNDFYHIQESKKISIGNLAQTIQDFKNKKLIDLSFTKNSFEEKLYVTYASYQSVT